MLRSPRKDAALLVLFMLGLAAGPATAGPISAYGGDWRIWFWDTEVACGTRCSTDQIQWANFDIYDLEGANGRVYSAQSGDAYAAMSVQGFGRVIDTDTSFEYQLTITRSLFASVAEGALPETYSVARAGLSGFLGFTIDEEVVYTGTPFWNLEYGSILGPGSHYLPIYSGFENYVLTTDVQRAGEQNFVSDIQTFTFRVESVQVPEPGTLALLGAGLVGIVAARRRRKQVNQ